MGPSVQDVARACLERTSPAALSESDDELRGEAGSSLLGGVVGAVRGGGASANADGAVAGHERGDIDLVPGSREDGAQRGQGGRGERRRGVPGHRPLAPGAWAEHAVKVASRAGAVEAVE